MSEQTFKFEVAMTCGGCSGAVKKNLEKLDKVTNIEIDLDTKTVLVTTTEKQEIILKAIKNTNLKTSYVGTV